MVALIAACMDPAYPARIVKVISNRTEAAGLKIAADYGIDTQAVPHRDYDSREAHEAALNAALQAAKPDIVCLAGYMRLFTPGFVKAWSGRMINIHPSLLPSFKGVDTHERALEAGCRIHGCSVHFVTADMDEGPIIAQAAVPVLGGDTPDSLAARVLKAEHRLYPMALRMVADRTVRMAAGRAAFSGLAERDETFMLVSPDQRRGMQVG